MKIGVHENIEHIIQWWDFLKYEFNNKLLSCVTLFRVTSNITWTLHIHITITHIKFY